MLYFKQGSNIEEYVLTAGIVNLRLYQVFGLGYMDKNLNVKNVAMSSSMPGLKKSINEKENSSVIGDRNARMANSLVRSCTLRAFCYCGLAGILVDIDHPIQKWFLGEDPSRFLHPYFLAIACVIIFCGCAYCGRLYIKHLLRQE